VRIDTCTRIGANLASSRSWRIGRFDVDDGSVLWLWMASIERSSTGRIMNGVIGVPAQLNRAYVTNQRRYHQLSDTMKISAIAPLQSLLLWSFLHIDQSFVIKPKIGRTDRSPSYRLAALSDDVSRRQFVLTTLVGVATVSSTCTGSAPARADVSDGTSLPNGAQQFARVVRLKSDVKVKHPCRIVDCAVKSI
jgi:hypothetical protein